MIIRALKPAAMTALCLLAAGCATLPDTDAIIARHTAQAARFETARGPLSARRSAAILAELKRKSGDIDILEKQRGKPLAPKEYFPALKAQGNEIVRAIGSTPDDPYSLIYLTLISAIGNAENQVYLTNAYFVPDPQLLKSLLEAAGRGVDVKLILPSHSDSAVVFHAGRSHYSTLLKGGVKLYERRGALLHSKTAIIDGVWSCVGSSNLDWRSFLDNDEVNAVVLGREFARHMQAMFARDLEASEAIDPERWERRPLLLRFKEWMARVWERLL